MTGDIPKRYNVLDEPWIPVLMADGSRRAYGLVDLFANAGDIRSLACDTESQNVAVLRLLAAIVYRATDPLLSDEWKDYYHDGLPVEAITSYLRDHGDRFWLFHPTHPFMQFGGNMEPSNGHIADASAIMQAGVGDDEVFASRRGRSATVIPIDAAVRWLLSTVQYDPSGRRTPYAGDPYINRGAAYTTKPYLASMSTLWLDGGDLAHTILLSCVPLDSGVMTPALSDDGEPTAGVPAWELEPLAPEDGDIESFKTTPVRATTILEALTWRGRRVRLYDDGGDVVSRTFVSMGLPVKLGDTRGLEPMAVWTKAADADPWGIAPRQYSDEMASWRGIRSIIESGSDSDFRTSAAIEWTRTLMMDRFLPHDYVADAHLLTLRYDVSMSALVTDIIVDSIGIPLSVLGASKAVVLDAVKSAEDAARALGAFIHSCNIASGADDDSRQSAPSRRMALAGEMDLYGRLEGRFHDWLLELGADVSTLDDWKNVVRQVTLGVVKEREAALPMAAFYGRRLQSGTLYSAAKSDIILRAKLKSL